MSGLSNSNQCGSDEFKKGSHCQLGVFNLFYKFRNEKKVIVAECFSKRRLLECWFGAKC